MASGDSIYSVTVAGSQTYAGSSDNVASAAVIRRGATNVTSSYTITYVKGTLTVTPRALTIKADSDSKVYDGTALTDNGYTLTSGTLASGDSIASVTVAGSQTNVGSSDNVASNAVIMRGATNITSSYAVTYEKGTLTVTKRPIEITADSNSKVYDGTALTDSDYAITNGTLAPDHRIKSVTVTGSQTPIGQSDNVASVAVIVTGEGLNEVDVTDNYEVTYVKGLLTVTPKALVIRANSNSKVYDGTALTDSGYALVSGTLASGDTIASVTVAGSQTNAGSSDNTASNAVIMNGLTNVTSNYTITYEKGTLTVTPKALTITADSNTKIYDGTALTDSGYTPAGLAAGDDVDTITVAGSQTNVGLSGNVASNAVIRNAGGTDVTASYTITYVDGTLAVTPRIITVLADSNSKVYDGTALTDSGYAILPENTATPTYGLAAGHTLGSITVTGSQTLAGSSANVPSGGIILAADETNVTANYTILYANGTLTVTPKALTITADSNTKIYDGTALTDSGYTPAGLAAGDDVDTITVAGSQTNVGLSGNVASNAVIRNAGGTDVTASYTITYVDGTLAVTPRIITVLADSNSKVYDGTALTDSGYAILPENTATPTYGLAAGHTLGSITVTGSQTLAGSSANVPSGGIILAADETNVTANYTILYANGTLTVTPKALTITADSNTKIYDGTALTDSGYTPAGLAAGDDVDTITVAGSQTNVGFSGNVVSNAVIRNAGGTDVTASYTITYVDGTLAVTVREITITAASNTKVYDATALEDDGYSLTGGTLAAGQTIKSVNVAGSQTPVGSNSNVASGAVIVSGTGDEEVNVTANYQITYVDGTLAVTPRIITVLADSNSKVYDGTALTDSGYTILPENTATPTYGLAAGHTLSNITVTGSQTLVGSSANVPSGGAILAADEADVTDNYTILYANGTLTVTPKALTITADSNTKIYDGTALTDSGYTPAGLAAGDYVDTITVTGTQTNVGFSGNVASNAVIRNAGGTDVTASYTITYVDGTLTVTAREITITAGSAQKYYDGTALTDSGYTLTSGTLAAGQTIKSVTVTGSQTLVGLSGNVANNAVIVTGTGDEEADVTANYDISYIDGTLEVDPVSLKIKKALIGTMGENDTFTVVIEGQFDEGLTSREIIFTLADITETVPGILESAEIDVPGVRANTTYTITEIVTVNGVETTTAYEAAFGPDAAAELTAQTPDQVVTVTNRLLTSFTATKVWDDAASETRPQSITVQLLANGSPYGDPVTLDGTSEPAWTHTWEGLYAYDLQNGPITYTIEEASELPEAYRSYVVEGNTIVNTLKTPVVQLSKAVDKTQVLGGEQFAYTVTLTNSMLRPVYVSNVYDSLAAGQTFVAFTDQGTGSAAYNTATRIITWNGTVPAATLVEGVLVPGTTSFTFTVTADELTALEQGYRLLRNNATGEYTDPYAEEFPGEGQEEPATYPLDSNEVQVEVFGPVMSITKETSKTESHPGETLTYTLRVQSRSLRAFDVTVSDLLADGITFQSFTTTGFGEAQDALNAKLLTWNFTMPAATFNPETLEVTAPAEVTLTFVVSVDAIKVDQDVITIENSATVTPKKDDETPYDPIPSNEVETDVSAAVTAHKAASVVDMYVGDPTQDRRWVYVFTLTNTNTAPMRVNLVDEFNTNINFYNWVNAINTDPAVFPRVIAQDAYQDPDTGIQSINVSLVLAPATVDSQGNVIPSEMQYAVIVEGKYIELEGDDSVEIPVPNTGIYAVSTNIADPIDPATAVRKNTNTATVIVWAINGVLPVTGEWVMILVPFGGLLTLAGVMLLIMNRRKQLRLK